MPSVDTAALRTAVSPEPASLSGVSSDDRRRARERQKALLRNVRRGVLAALLVGATGAAVVALRPRPVPIDAAKATRKPLVVAVEESGMTRVLDRYVVSAPVSGRVSRIRLEPGDVVHEGDTLAEMA